MKSSKLVPDAPWTRHSGTAAHEVRRREASRIDEPSRATAAAPSHATAAAPPHAIAARGDVIAHGRDGSTLGRWAGWSDTTRGVNANLGDTEAALHLFFGRHTNLHGAAPAEGTAQAARLKALHLWADVKAFAHTADPAETYWKHDDSRTLYVSDRDRQVAKKIYAAQSPNGSPARPVASDAPELRSLERFVAQNRYDATIDRALAIYPTPGVDAKIVKSLLIQESGLDPNVGTNAAGYSGIAQLAKNLASLPEANDPFAAIPIAAKALQEKARYLDEHPFATYGRPSAVDRLRSIVGAYNAGQETIADAMRIARAEAYATGVRERPAALAARVADGEATHWSSLVAPTNDPARSPLYDVIPTGWGKAAKYVETSSYVVDILTRAKP